MAEFMHRGMKGITGDQLMEAHRADPAVEGDEGRALQEGMGGSGHGHRPLPVRRPLSGSRAACPRALGPPCGRVPPRAAQRVSREASPEPAAPGCNDPGRRRDGGTAREVISPVDGESLGTTLRTGPLPQLPTATADDAAVCDARREVESPLEALGWDGAREIDGLSPVHSVLVTTITAPRAIWDTPSPAPNYCRAHGRWRRRPTIRTSGRTARKVRRGWRRRWRRRFSTSRCR